MDKIRAMGCLGWLALVAAVGQTVVGWATGQSLAVPAAVTALVGIAGRLVAWAYTHPDNINPTGIVVALAMIVGTMAPALSGPAAPVPAAEVPAVQPAPAPVFPYVPTDPDSGPVSMIGQVGWGALAVAAAILPVGCSALSTQTKADLAKTGLDIGACLAECGLHAAVDAGLQQINVGSVNGPGLRQEGVDCAMLCASKVGLNAIVEIARDLMGPRVTWFGTASSDSPPNLYRVRLVPRAPGP
jgi:hypothetical protein